MELNDIIVFPYKFFFETISDVFIFSFSRFKESFVISFILSYILYKDGLDRFTNLLMFFFPWKSFFVFDYVYSKLNGFIQTLVLPFMFLFGLYLFPLFFMIYILLKYVIICVWLLPSYNFMAYFFGINLFDGANWLLFFPLVFIHIGLIVLMEEIKEKYLYSKK